MSEPSRFITSEHLHISVAIHPILTISLSSQHASSTKHRSPSLSRGIPSPPAIDIPTSSSPLFIIPTQVPLQCTIVEQFFLIPLQHSSAAASSTHLHLELPASSTGRLHPSYCCCLCTAPRSAQPLISSVFRSFTNSATLSTSIASAADIHIAEFNTPSGVPGANPSLLTSAVFSGITTSFICSSNTYTNLSLYANLLHPTA